MNGYQLLSIHLLFDSCKVPGERIVGSYALDDLKEYTAVHLKATSEVCSLRPFLQSTLDLRYLCE